MNRRNKWHGSCRKKVDEARLLHIQRLSGVADSTNWGGTGLPMRGGCWSWSRCLLVPLSLSSLSRFPPLFFTNRWRGGGSAPVPPVATPLLSPIPTPQIPIWFHCLRQTMLILYLVARICRQEYIGKMPDYATETASYPKRKDACSYRWLVIVIPLESCRKPR